jgi:hypothetical protein
MLVVAAALGGCFVVPMAKAPAIGAVATGEPLAVVDDIKVWTTEETEKVGEAVHRDAAGNTVGSTDVYAARTQVHTQKVWYLAQGREQLPDEDFFRIAGDDEALQATAQMRAGARRKVRIGQVSMAVGVVAAIASYFVPQPMAKVGLSLGGTAAVCGGWYIGNSGAKEMESDHHAVARSIAERDARAYNQRVTGVGVSGSF